jgi:hypothetical protein
LPPIVLNTHTAPTPPAPPPVVPPGPPAAPESAWYDIPGQISKAISTWFRDLLHEALNPVIDLLARTALVTPDLTAEPRIVQIWTLTQTIANSAYVLLVVVGGLVVMTQDSLQTRHGFTQIAPRVVLGFVALNVSLSVVGEAIRVTNTTAAALLGTDGTPEAVAARLKTQLFGGLDQAGIFMLLVALIIVALVVVVLIVFVMRVALTVLLVAVAPLALACHALPATEGAARLWWRGLLAVLAIQLAQALTLVVAVRVFFTPTGLGGFGGGGVLTDLLVTLVLVWVLVRIPTWISRSLLGTRPSTLSSLVKYAVLSRALGSVGLGRLAARRATTGRAAASRASGAAVGGGLTRGGRPVQGWSGRLASVEFGNHPTVGGSGGTPRRGRAAPLAIGRPSRTGGSQSEAAEYPAGAGNHAAEPPRWWGTPTFRAAGTRPPVTRPRFQPPHLPTTAPVRRSVIPGSAARPPAAAASTQPPATPTFSSATHAPPQTPTRAVPRPASGSPKPTFSDTATPQRPTSARGGSPVASFRPPGGASSTAPGSRRRGSGRAWIPPGNTGQPPEVKPSDEEE